MALVTVQRSPCSSSATTSCQTADDAIDGSESQEEGDENQDQRSVSECYFAVKGAALVLPHDECLHVYRKNSTHGANDIQQHLQAMFYLLRPEDTLKMAVKLESVHLGRTRYLVVVSCIGQLDTEESCLLGIDCNTQTTIGLVLPVWADTRITLDGDGGFSVSSIGRHHIFKPVSVQAMWSALQTVHKASAKAREYNYYMGGGTHQWIYYYEKSIASDRSCLNEWHAMDDLESRRPPSPDTARSEPTEREATEKLIRTKLKELMSSVDLDEVTSKYIRTRLEEQLDMNLNEFKPFIDQEMLTILGQMDAPTEIFEYLYLGSEWNASNLEELKYNQVGHILNVTREIDNFFPGMFDYLNVRVYDDESTEMLQHWDKTYKYIAKAKDEGSKVLVHCKMGISRSASVVIAYVMKAYDWDLEQALHFVKKKRNCIKPNSGFLKQLEIYQGILDASKHRHNSLWRSKSETNLKSSERPRKTKKDELKENSAQHNHSLNHLTIPGSTCRPKSWSPDDVIVNMLFPSDSSSSDDGVNKEELPKKSVKIGKLHGRQRRGTDQSHNKTSDPMKISTSPVSSVAYKEDKTGTLQLPSLPSDNTSDGAIPRVSSIKDRINELESHVHTVPEVQKTLKPEKSSNALSRSGLVLNLATHFESGSKPSTPSPVEEGLTMKVSLSDQEIVEPVVSQTKPPVPKHHAVLVKPTSWSSEDAALRDASNTTALQSGQVQALGHKSDVSESLAKESISSISIGENTAQKEILSTNKAVVPSSLNVCKKLEDDHEDSTACTNMPKLLQSPLISQLVSSSVTKDEGLTSLPKKTSHIEKDLILKSTSDETSEVMHEKTGKMLSRSKDACISPSTSVSSADKLQQSVNSSISNAAKLHSDQEAMVLPNQSVQDVSVCSSSSPESPSQTGSPKYCFRTTPLEENHIHSQSPLTPPSSQSMPSKGEFSYEKEDIPWTPGKVLRTKQQIEEKNLTRTSSFDAGFPSRPHSTPSTPPDSDSMPGKPVQRSHSFRSEHRPTSMFEAGKWYALPCLTSISHKPSPCYQEHISRCSDEGSNRHDMVHSISTPSVVEAVNKVICGTQEVLTSVIRSLPLDRHSVPPSARNSPLPKSKPDFGSVSSLPDSLTAFGKLQAQTFGDSPAPGTVKHQRELLESMSPKPASLNKNSRESYNAKKEQMRLIKEYGRNLVSNDTFADSKDAGLVKRMTKELEAKSGSEISRKERIVIVNRESKELSDLSKRHEHGTLLVRSLSTPSSPDMETRSRTIISCIKSSRNSEALHNIKPSAVEERLQQPPPTPHRKTSLDLECLKSAVALSQKQSTSSQCPFTSETYVHDTNLNSPNSLKSSKTTFSTNGFQKNAFDVEHQNPSEKRSHQPPDGPRIAPGRPPPVTKLPNPPPPPPPPPPLGLPRRVRKQQQGSSHPLSKLTARQRHANPLYNTM